MIKANKSELNIKQKAYTEEELKETAERDLRLYIVVNKTLRTTNSSELSKGKMEAQVGHGVEVFQEKVLEIINSEETPQEKKEEYEKELEIYKRTRKKIILEGKEKDLKKLETEGYLAIRDKGLTEIEPNALTVVVLGIYSREELPKELKRYQLRK